MIAIFDYGSGNLRSAHRAFANSGEKVTVTADEDYYLALGDNTNGSYDSRMWGFVKESRIKGKAFVRFWPLNRISLLK